MESKSPLFVPHQWEETNSRVAHPLDDGRRGVVGDRRFVGPVGPHVDGDTEAFHLQIGDVLFRDIGDFLVGVMKDVDVV